MQYNLGALHHENAGDLGHVDFATRDHGEAAEFGFNDGEDFRRRVARRIGIEHIVRRRESSGVHAPIAENDVSVGRNQEA